MFTKINFLPIIKDQHKGLINYNTRKVDFGSIFTFYLFPAILATPLVFTKTFMDKDGVNTAITILSIFVGLLLNVIVIIFDIIKEEKPNVSEKKKKLRLELLKEVFASAAFSIVISIFAITFSLLCLIKIPYFQYVFNSITYWLLGLFLVNLLMILKRLYGLLTVEFRDKITE